MMALMILPVLVKATMPFLLRIAIAFTILALLAMLTVFKHMPETMSIVCKNPF